jgi:hypothetical protein
MAITVSWDDEARTIIRMDFAGKWTWTELQDANAQMAILTDEVAHPISVITDVSKTQYLPDGALSEARSISGGMMARGKNTLIVAVGASTLVKSLFPIFFNVYGKRTGFPMTHFVNTLEDARALIDEKRVTMRTDAAD